MGVSSVLLDYLLQTILSHLSSHSDSRSGSACTVFSQSEETIQWKKGNVLGKGAFGTVSRSNKNIDIKFRHVSGITSIMYTQSRKCWKAK